MSKKLIAVLIIFLIAAGCLIFVKFVYLNDPKFQPLNKQPLSSVVKEASLSLLPNPLTATASSSASVDVVLKTQEIPNLVQLEIAYDPTAIYNVSIIPGGYFSNPQVLLNNIDVTTGRISYALKGDSVNPNINTVATINFNSLNYGLQKETEISFLPKALIRNDSGEIKLYSITGAKVIIRPSYFYFNRLPQASPSAIVK